jgi:hypothetical protein
MENIMFAVTVTAPTGETGQYVNLSQPDFGDGGSQLVIHVDMIETLIKWLREAAEEINKNSNAVASLV